MSLSRIEELLEMINNKSGPTDMIPLSRTEEILKCYINGISYTGPITSRFEELLYNTLYKQPSDEQPLSRSEEILKSKIDKTTYEGAILSRVEELLLELKTEPDPVEITIGPDTILHVLNAIEAAAVSLKIDLTPTQDGTPWISDTLNTEPYLSRAAQNGNTADETIVGGTVAWNQLADESTAFSFSNAMGSTVDGVCTFTASAQNGMAYKSVSGASLVNHVLLGKISYKTITATNDVDTRVFSITVKGSATTNWQTTYLIAKAMTSSAKSIGVRDKRESGWDSIQTKDMMICDLTLMFGSTIADYIYSLEQATAGDGVAWLHSHGFIDDSYHAYNTGTLISAKPTAKVVGDTTYPFGGADLRGLFKLDANNNLYCDGDVYTADGTITRNFGIVDLGNLTWTYYGTETYPNFRAIIPHKKIGADAINFICNNYVNTLGDRTTLIFDKTIAAGNLNNSQTVAIRDDSYTSAATFKAAMNGVYLVYELATPATEQSTAYTNPQKAGEAESFVDARSEKVPVGHSTRYSAEYDINGYNGLTVHVSETQTGGTTYPVTFTSQGTVYGGTIDVVSGEMSITWAIADMGDLEWIQPATGYGYFIVYFNSYNTGDEIFGLLTTSYPKSYTADMSYIQMIASGTKQRGIAVRDSRYNDVTVFKTAVTGQKVAYELSTPITATIDPTTINISEGESYVWAEEGNSTLTYMGIPVTRKRSK